MCGPHRRFAPLLPRTLRRIPQAVSTIATSKIAHAVVISGMGFNTVNGQNVRPCGS